MRVPLRHVLHQGPVLATLARVAASAVRPPRSSPLPHLPSPEVEAELAPLPESLLRDYIRHVGGDPAAYRGQVPAHLFPQWGIPLAARASAGLPYPLFKVLNGGCRLEMHAPLPSGQPLRARARIEAIEEDDRRVLIEQRIATGTRDAPEAVVGHVYAVIPKPKPASRPDRPGTKATKERARVPLKAEEIGRWKLGPHTGFDFAKLTGDFNPLHWLPPYARAMGFRSALSHGYATMARALEGLQRALFAGSVHAVQTFDVKFTKPLVVPCRVRLYVRDDEVFVGEAPGSLAYLTGRYVPRPLRDPS